MLILAIALLAAALGIMVFFAALVTPSAFRALPKDEAGRFIRTLFPLYYFALGVLTTLAALIAAYAVPLAAALVGVAAAGFVFARQFIRPRLNALRDAAQAGDPEAKRQFDGLHRTSVLLNAAQLVLLLVAIGWIAVAA
jgi:flagellar biosynthesis protein FlhB